MKNWKKGTLHCHTLWSDGSSLPEVVLQTYRNCGYDFVCISDHNVFQQDPEVFLQVHESEGDWPPNLSQKEYERSCGMLAEPPESKQFDVRTLVRLKTWKELKKAWEIPGEFLVIPGEEVSIRWVNFGEKDRAYQMHFNIFGIEKEFHFSWEGTAHELTARMIEHYQESAGDSFLMLNHPFYRAWDVDPRILIDFPEIRLFEICNSGTHTIPENWIYDREQYWDFILAHRLAAGKPLLFGTATDDAHYFDPERRNVPGTYETGWVMVNCPGEFTQKSLAEALVRGDFYSTSGVLLEDVGFDPQTGELQVRIQPEDGVEYRIDFITTGKDFDRTIELREYPFENHLFSRIRPVIPDGIGKISKSVQGTSASYRMNDNDLYVRALITSNRKNIIQNHFHPVYQTAWTQPFCKQRKK